MNNKSQIGKTTETDLLHQMAAAVAELAEENYHLSFGWQVFVECYTEEEMLHFVKGCRSIPEALKLAARLAAHQTERDFRGIY